MVVLDLTIDRRPRMGIVGRAVSRIKGDLDGLLGKGVVEAACRACGHSWRERVLGPVTTVHLLILQLLEATALAGLRHVSGVHASASALCQAKARLPLAVLRELL